MAASPLPQPLDVVVLDVFTREVLQGNQLAVFPDGRALSTEQMQALARETNLSETTFILPRAAEIEEKEGIHVRIFTVSEELPFAGHPTLGTAAYLYEQRGRTQATITLDLKCGKVPVSFSPRDGGAMYGEMVQREPVFGATHVVADFVQRVCTVALDPSLPIHNVSTGIPFAIVPVASLAALRDLTLSSSTATKYLADTDAKFLYFLARDDEHTSLSSGAPPAPATPHEAPAPVSPHHFRARMIFYNGEDPATGSAAGCAVSYLVHHNLLPPGAPAIIYQGEHVGRPSTLHVAADRTADGRVCNVRVGGYTRLVMRGQYFI